MYRMFGSSCVFLKILPKNFVEKIISRCLVTWDFLYVKHTASRKSPDFILNFISFTFVTKNRIITQNVIHIRH